MKWPWVSRRRLEDERERADVAEELALRLSKAPAILAWWDRDAILPATGPDGPWNKRGLALVVMLDTRERGRAPLRYQFSSLMALRAAWLDHSPVYLEAVERDLAYRYGYQYEGPAAFRCRACGAVSSECEADCPGCSGVVLAKTETK